MPSLLLLVQRSLARSLARLLAGKLACRQQLFLLGANIHTILVEFA